MEQHAAAPQLSGPVASLWIVLRILEIAMLWTIVASGRQILPGISQNFAAPLGIGVLVFFILWRAWLISLLSVRRLMTVSGAVSVFLWTDAFFTLLALGFGSPSGVMIVIAMLHVGLIAFSYMAISRRVKRTPATP